MDVSLHETIEKIVFVFFEIGFKWKCKKYQKTNKAYILLNKVLSYI